MNDNNGFKYFDFETCWSHLSLIPVQLDNKAKEKINSYENKITKTKTKDTESAV